MRFLLDLLTPDETMRAATTLIQVLEGAYRPSSSEIALHLAVLWQQEQPALAPRPKTWNLTGGDLTGAHLAGCHLDNVQFAHVRLTGANLTNARLTGSLQQADLSRIQAPGADLSGCDLTAANLAGARLTDSRLDQANLASIFLQRADLRCATMNKARLSHTRLAWSRLDPDSLTGIPPDDFSMMTLPPMESLSHVQALFQQGHTDEVHTMAFSPDGTTILSGGFDQTLKLWDARTGQCVRTFQGHQDLINSVTFSPDGTTILSGSTDKTLKLWNTHTGECIQSLQGQQSWINSVAFSPDGKKIVSAGEAIRVWDLQTNRELFALWSWDDEGWVSISPEGQIVACNPENLSQVGFVHENCVYPGEEFADCFRTT